MAWNIEALLLIIMSGLAFWLGASFMKDGMKVSQKALMKETQNLYREIENLREIVYYYENRPIRQGNSSATGTR